MTATLKKIGSGGRLKGALLLGGFFIAVGINLYAFKALANSCSDFRNFSCQSPLEVSIGGSYWCDKYIQTYLGKFLIQKSQTGAISCNPDAYNTPQNVEDEALRLFGTPKVIIKNCITGWYPVISASCYDPTHRQSFPKDLLVKKNNTIPCVTKAPPAGARGGKVACKCGYGAAHKAEFQKVADCITAAYNFAISQSFIWTSDRAHQASDKCEKDNPVTLGCVTRLGDDRGPNDDGCAHGPK